MAAANEQVMGEFTKPARKCRKYVHYIGETRVKMGRYAVEHGNKSAVDKFTKELGHPDNENTICNSEQFFCGS